MISFRNLLNDNTYQRGLYFYHLESKINRSPLEETLLRSYRSINKPIDQCCCDTGPIKNCDPTCCNQVQCSTCNVVIRICKDAWFCHDNIVLCIKCKPRI